MNAHMSGGHHEPIAKARAPSQGPATADLYLRLSIDFEGATSIDRQESDCRRWCAANNATVRAVHVDRGVSGYSETAHRDGFDAALEAVTCGAADILVVWKLDRLSRRGVGQVGQVLDLFAQAGGRLVSVQDQLDTAQPQARMIIALLSEFARAESETMGVRVKSAKLAQRAQGLWLSGKPPYGYAIAADRRLVPVEPAAGIMREVFQRLAAGHTLTSTCQFLNDAGVRNSRGNRWQSSALSEAIRSPAYAGLTPDRHVTSAGLHAPGYPTIFRNPDTGLEVSCLTARAKPIVSRTVQLAAFAMLEQRWTRYGRGVGPRRQAHALLLRGLGRCGSCGQPLVTFNGYRCRRVDRFGDTVCERPVNATVAAVDTRVADHWIQLVTSPGANVHLLLTLSRRWAGYQRRPPTWVKLEARLDDLRTRVADADAAHYVRGDLDTARHANVVGKLTRLIAHVETELADHEPGVPADVLSDEGYVRAKWTETGYDGRRELLAMTWSSIIVAKAASPGGTFDERRISYTPLKDGPWQPPPVRP